MTQKIVDARGMACPQPVVLTIGALKEAAEVITIVDSSEARENIARLGKDQGCEVSVKQEKDGTYITLKKNKPAEKNEESSPPGNGTVLFISSNVLGRGSDVQLGGLLMEKFLHTVAGLNTRPEIIILINEGVTLATAESPLVGELQALEGLKVQVLACGTCLSRFKLTDKMAVGQVSNMFEIASALMSAGKIISL
jgi:selenium metabolism protein YedF